MNLITINTLGAIATYLQAGGVILHKYVLVTGTQLNSNCSEVIYLNQQKIIKRVHDHGSTKVYK